MKSRLWMSLYSAFFLYVSLLHAGDSAPSLFTPLPTPKNGGFRLEGYWVWDPSLVQASDGKWHLFASRWPKTLPMHPGWLLGSEVVRAEGDRPEGPFTFKEVVFPARGPGYWDGRITHNPRVQTIVEKGQTKYVMFYLGSTHPFGDPKPGETITLNDPKVVVARANKRIGVAVADRPEGPWVRFDQPILPTRPGHFDDFLTSNPAVVFRADGSVYMMYKARRYQGADKDYAHGPMTIGAAVAPHYLGPWKYLTDEPLFSPDKVGEIEDPFVYEQEGVLHMIAKDMSGKIGGEAHGGIHAVSRDGVKWELGTRVKAWSRSLVWDDGSTQVMGNLERPYVLFQNGKPTHLLGAVSDGLGGFAHASNTWDIVIPLGGTETSAVRKVETLLEKMSDQDKLAQLMGIRPNDLMENGKLSLAKCKALIPHGIGHLCQYSSSLALPPDELRDLVRELQHYLMTQTPAGIPAIFHEEALTGCPSLGGTTFPQHIGIGCTWNPELAEQKTRFTAETMRKAGATQALSPMLDLCRSAHWARMEESLGEDAYLTSRLGLAFVKGLQGSNLRTGIAATSKHFAGYGLPNEDKKEFMEETLMPHEVVIKLGDVQSIMPGYHAYKGIRCAGNQELLADILRNQLGFSGLVVSDYGAVYGLVKGTNACDETDAAVKAINAGTDVELSKGKCFPFLPAAIQSGKVSPDTFDTAVRRVLTLKERVGLLDEHPEIGKDGHLDFDPPEHRQLAYEAACQSLVLLKNNGILPLGNGVRKIALVGPNAASCLSLLGDYTYQSLAAFWWNIPVNPESPKLVTLLDGLKYKVGGGVTLVHERGCDWSKPLEAKINTKDPGDSRLDKVKMMIFKDLPKADPEKALRIAAESDVIIAAMGENVYLCGEGRERDGIRLPGDQEEFVKKLLDTGKPVILVMFGGRP